MRIHAPAHAALLLFVLYLLSCAVRADAADQDVGVEAAAAALGVESASLSAASISTGFSVPKLVDIVRSDPAARISNGGLLYTCSLGRKSSSRTPTFTPVSAGVPGAAVNDDTVSVASWPVNQNDSSVPLTEAAVFKLHSRGAVTRKVQLAFKGCTTSVSVQRKNEATLYQLRLNAVSTCGLSCWQYALAVLEVSRSCSSSCYCQSLCTSRANLAINFGIQLHWGRHIKPSYYLVIAAYLATLLHRAV
jgi:hypothetical protein